MRNYRPTFFILVTSLFIVLILNRSFFEHVFQIYPPKLENIGFLFSLVLVLYSLLVTLFSLVSFRYTLKPILVFVLFISAGIDYFMQSYNIVMDKTMIENILQTDTKESFDLLNTSLFLSLFIYWLLPSIIIYKLPMHYLGFRIELWSSIKRIFIHLFLILVVLFGFSKFYASFFREHKILRLYTNPTSAVYNMVSYTYKQLKSGDTPIKIIGEDAKIVPQKNRKRKIVIMVVGEAARADHFSLNGYKKETNPLLKKEDIINFSRFYSCGTTTAVSVPCMFSVYDRDEYDTQKGYNTHNALDILFRAGVDVLWRDNNSDSKGVASRVRYEHYKSSKLNSVCDEVECRDEGMLVGLDSILNESKKDIIIVLHQMGNHGPAYYLRSPKRFKKFLPECKTNQLESCSIEEINNAYDNAILYTDFFLSRVIALLKDYEKKADTAMIYIADHGESLGENGLYLHGLPYFIAPNHQKHVGALMWFSKSFPIDKSLLQKKSNQKFSHDNLFSTLLGIFDIQSSVYEGNMDILKN